METIKIKTGEYYTKPEFYPYMPPEIFDALELAELKGALHGEEILAEVSKEAFEKMIDDFNAEKRNEKD